VDSLRKIRAIKRGEGEDYEVRDFVEGRSLDHNPKRTSSGRWRRLGGCHEKRSARSRLVAACTGKKGKELGPKAASPQNGTRRRGGRGYTGPYHFKTLYRIEAGPGLKLKITQEKNVA